MRWELYVHVPFCRQKCYYCDFPSYAGRERYMEAYVDALCCELAVRGFLYLEKWGSPATIYIGGGTPTALPSHLMEKLLHALAVFGMAEEFTVEANPGTVDAPYLATLRAYGVNRLSVGVQSFEDRLLAGIGRIHTSEQAVRAVLMARQAGFENISIDLMYALPQQSMEDLQRSVEQALSLAVPHISIYGLQLEEGTVFFRQQEMGKLCLPSEELAEQMYDYMTETLPAHGYERYEISNFARKGFEGRHNLGYWQDVPYLGVGAAAHSYLEGIRWENTASLQEYISCQQEGRSAGRLEEEVSAENSMEEYAFLALRTAEGIWRERFLKKFSVSLESVYGDAIRRMEERGLLFVDTQGVRLTKLGMKFGNIVFEEFLL